MLQEQGTSFLAFPAAGGNCSLGKGGRHGGGGGGSDGRRAGGRGEETRRDEVFMVGTPEHKCCETRLVSAACGHRSPVAGRTSRAPVIGWINLLL